MSLGNLISWTMITLILKALHWEKRLTPLVKNQKCKIFRDDVATISCDDTYHPSGSECPHLLTIQQKFSTETFSTQNVMCIVSMGSLHRGSFSNRYAANEGGPRRFSCARQGPTENVGILEVHLAVDPLAGGDVITAGVSCNETLAMRSSRVNYGGGTPQVFPGTHSSLGRRKNA